MLRDTLLTIHILAVIVWLGFGLYELLLTREIHKARGTQLEIQLMKIYGKYAPIVAIATLVVALTGVLMSIFLGWGFFQNVWLGIKQAIMLAVLLDMTYLIPTFIRGAKEIEALSNNGGRELEAYRETQRTIDRHVVLMRLGSLIAVILAVWRPM